MKMRTILLDSFIELDHGEGRAMAVDLLEQQVRERHVSAEDFAIELTAAIHDGDLAITSPGMLKLTQAGARHYRESLALR